MAKPDVRYAGLSDREALSQVMQDVKDVVQNIHRQRGHTTDEDLLEKTMWQLEKITGVTPDAVSYTHLTLPTKA